jgi:hypothetical protein
VTTRASPNTLAFMATVVDDVAALLREVADLHHRTYRLTDGADADWASFYADWLARHSELDELLGVVPVRSHLTWLLVQAERDAGATADWAVAYAAAIVGHYSDESDIG